MSKYVPHKELGKCGYDSCPTPYRSVYNDSPAVLVYDRDSGITHYHLECYVKLKEDKYKTSAHN